MVMWCERRVQIRVKRVVIVLVSFVQIACAADEQNNKINNLQIMANIHNHNHDQTKYQRCSPENIRIDWPNSDGHWRRIMSIPARVSPDISSPPSERRAIG